MIVCVNYCLLFLSHLETNSQMFGLVMAFNATFSNISVILWWSVLLVEETGENHRPVASHGQTLSHNVVHLALIDWLIVFNTTFSNISAISWRPVLVVEEAGVPERTTDHGQAAGKLYHLRLWVECTFFFVIYSAGCEPTPYWWWACKVIQLPNSLSYPGPHTLKDDSNSQHQWW